MKRFFFRIKALCIVGLYAFKNPDPFSIAILRDLGTLYERLWRIAENKDPEMFKIATSTMEGKENITLVSIWAGPGADADPWDRVRELREENERLKKEVAKLQEKRDQ
jgi:hypothetical protein